jgi:16S rRNA C1402 (ribose-2'-O) methylase RsmI
LTTPTEMVVRGSASQVIDYFRSSPFKGESTIIVAGKAGK